MLYAHKMSLRHGHYKELVGVLKLVCYTQIWLLLEVSFSTNSIQMHMFAETDNSQASRKPFTATIMMCSEARAWNVCVDHRKQTFVTPKFSKKLFSPLFVFPLS